MPEVEGHPNRLPFQGVLTPVGVPSRRAPSGAQRHRGDVDAEGDGGGAAVAAGDGAGLSPALDGHDRRRKIGLITEADIVPMRVGGAVRRGRLRSVGSCMSTTFRTWSKNCEQAKGRWACRTKLRGQRGRQEVADLDGDVVHLYRGGGLAAGEGGYPETRFRLGNRAAVAANWTFTSGDRSLQ